MVSVAAEWLFLTIKPKTVKLSKSAMNAKATNNSVLHSDSPNNPAIQRMEQRGTQLHGEEASNFTITCIEVFGSTCGNTSCSKMCLANVNLLKRSP